MRRILLFRYTTTSSEAQAIILIAYLTLGQAKEESNGRKNGSAEEE